jgi:FlaA1/EpsC-like NDP-sugar epimerase
LIYSRATQYVIDICIASFALWVAYLLRFDWAIPVNHVATMWLWLMVLPLARVFSLWVFGCYNAIWRYFSLTDATRIVWASMPAAVLLLVFRYILFRKYSLSSVPVSVIVLETCIFLTCVGGVRVARRMTFEGNLRTGVVRKRTLLVGSPDSLAGTLRQVSVYPDANVVGMLSPDRKAHGLRIGGFAVVDEPAALPELLVSRSVDLVLIADASLDSIGAMVATASEFGAEVRLMPSAADIVRGDVRVSILPKVDETLIDRAVVAEAEVDPRVIEAFRDRTVLVTGAGGSIGSELSRQVSALAIRKIVLFDQDENSIFEISGELTARNSSAEIVPVVGDICNRERLRAVFNRYRPDVVLHAAAYKHVPVMEANCSEAVLNNVFGTREVVDAAIEYGAERFLMISTDKAVHPTCVMGATKRVAELLVQNRSGADGREVKTRCACVRFGNVVGSRGSVVPIFLRQIAAGGPVTITDEEMTRYFMTIPEAVQLVIQATTLGSSGDVYMLDMGNPVKITDLARKLIVMSGLQPGKDIEIRFVGTRPGEKIHEELWYGDSQVAETTFARVSRIKPNQREQFREADLDVLEQAARAREDEAVRALLHKLPITYRPAALTAHV